MFLSRIQIPCNRLKRDKWYLNVMLYMNTAHLSTSSSDIVDHSDNLAIRYQHVEGIYSTTEYRQ